MKTIAVIGAGTMGSGSPRKSLSMEVIRVSTQSLNADGMIKNSWRKGSTPDFTGSGQGDRRAYSTTPRVRMPRRRVGGGGGV